MSVVLESSMIIKSMTFYLWIRMASAMAMAALLFVTALIAILSREEVRRDQARAVLVLLRRKRRRDERAPDKHY
jgi:hypothetical protein